MRMNGCSIGLLALCLGAADLRAEDNAPKEPPPKKAAQERHVETGVVLKIDTEKMAFTLEREVEQDGKKTKISQDCVYHKVKEKYFKDLQPGDRIEITWYNKAGDKPIASVAKLIEKAKSREKDPKAKDSDDKKEDAGKAGEEQSKDGKDDKAK